jgi:single-strand DNA-binding protein
MADINQVVLVGRLTRDAELKYTNSGAAVSKFSLAVNQRRKKGDQWEDEVHYFDISLWGKTAEAINQYLVKGKQVGVQGQLRQDRWQQDGQNRSKVEIFATNVMLLGSGGGGRQGSAAPAEARGGAPEVPPDGGQPAPDNFEDDIPF